MANGGEEPAERIAEGLLRVTEAALAYLDLEDLLGELLDRIVDIVGADTAAILLVEPDGETLAARAAKGLEAEVERAFKLPIGSGFAGRIAETMEPVIIDDLDEATIEILNPVFAEHGVRSLLGVPMVVEGRLVGVLHVGTLEPRKFTPDDAQLLQAVADRAALAIEHDRLFVQHRIAETLQRRLLPTDLPEIPSVGFASRYIPASQASTVGGDWYDVFQLRDGRVAIAVGDVVGHGVWAASLMGELRTALRVTAMETPRPATVLAKLSAFVAERGMESMATCSYAVLDLDRAAITVASAAHPPPLLVTAEGARYIEHDTGPPLGGRPQHDYEEADFRVEPGEVLMLYTDGLIERRGELLSGGLERLAEVAADAPLDSELLCDRVVEALVPNGEDDVAVLAIQNLAPVNGRLELKLNARAEQLVVVRRAIKRWLRNEVVTPADVQATILAANEACSNAIEHAYGPRDATFELRAQRYDNTIEVTIRDYGHWRAARGRDRGRGLELMRAAMDKVEVTPSDAGTTVRLIRRLGQPMLLEAKAA
jgi:serine phosphatase RsbU (regulator of sigma subunit)/anti-sigma regulatory factor (Ser/Thr protein kinase)